MFCGVLVWAIWTSSAYIEILVFGGIDAQLKIGAVQLQSSAGS
jgi:hypothetical protein